MATKPRIVRKNLRLDQDKLTRAKKMLGAKTETEALDQLLDNYLVRMEIMQGIRRLREIGAFEGVDENDVFAAPKEA